MPKPTFPCSKCGHTAYHFHLTISALFDERGPLIPDWNEFDAETPVVCQKCGTEAAPEVVAEIKTQIEGEKPMCPKCKCETFEVFTADPLRVDLSERKQYDSACESRTDIHCSKCNYEVDANDDFDLHSEIMTVLETGNEAA